MKYLKATLLGSGALASLLLSSVLTSCQDEDFGYTTQEIRDSVYARNFEKMYGKISEDQIWDFSSYNLKKLGLTGGPSNDLMTRANKNDVHALEEFWDAVTVLPDWYTVSRGTTDWLNANLPEKEPYKGAVSAFKLKKTDNFYIIPIYQGQSGMIWDLELLDNNGRHLIWRKSQNFQYTYKFDFWEEFFYETNDFDLKDTYKTKSKETSIWNWSANGGVHKFTDWDGGFSIDISDIDFVLGDIINVDVQNPGTEPAISILTAFNPSRVYLFNGSDASNGTVQYTINQSDLNKINDTNTLYVQGHNITVTNVRITRGGGNNKGLKFERIFQYFDTSKSYKYAKTCFEIPQSVGTLQGYFYIKYGDGDNDIELIPQSYLKADGSTTTATVDKFGLVTFTNGNNPEIDPETGYLKKGGNQVDFSYLITHKEINGHSIGDKFQNLVFHATNTRFNTYAKDHERIKVIVKYNAQVEEVRLSDQATTAYVDGHTINKHDVQTKLIKIDSEKIDGLFQFNLYTKDLTPGDLDGYSDYASNHYSNEEYMLALTAFTSENSPVVKSTLKDHLNETYHLGLGDDFEYMVLGCEDADGSQSDHDYNDVCFLVVGCPKLPEISDTPIEKRYMIEDLGSTFDFDFNDIVVDVTEEHVRNLANPSEIKVRQTATIKHLCGTIPFKVFLGNKSFGDKPMYGHNKNNNAEGYDPATSSDPTAYTEELYVSPDWISISEANYPQIRRGNNIWDPETNNIKVYVWPDMRYDESKVGVYWSDYNSSVAADEDSYNNIDSDGPNHVYGKSLVEFPHKGKFPYIIATDPTIKWMQENISIPTDWMKTVPQEYYDWQNGTTPGSTNGSGGNNGSDGGGSGTPLSTKSYELSDKTANENFTIPADYFDGSKSYFKFELEGQAQLSATYLEIYNQNSKTVEITGDKLTGVKQNGLNCTLHCNYGTVGVKITITNY